MEQGEGLTIRQKDMLVQCIALKMLTDFTLMYSACVGVLLRRDAELGSGVRGLSPKAAVPRCDHMQSGLFRCATSSVQCLPLSCLDRLSHAKVVGLLIKFYAPGYG